MMDDVLGLVIIGCGLILFSILAVAVLIPMGRSFVAELKYVKMKLINSRNDNELAYWERRKKNLWVSLLPFHHYKPHGDHHHHTED